MSTSTNATVQSAYIQKESLKSIVQRLIAEMPTDWLRLTTHRLDVYDESQAKVEFTEKMAELVTAGEFSKKELSELPTAYDYIRLGHPLSSVMEWVIGQLNQTKSTNVISFASQITPILAVLRKNLMENRATRIVFAGDLPERFDVDAINRVYGYSFELVKVNDLTDLEEYDGTTVYLDKSTDLFAAKELPQVDIAIKLHDKWGSVLLVNKSSHEEFVSEIQHVRRRETIAMTPSDCYAALNKWVGYDVEEVGERKENKAKVIASIKEITTANTTASIGSSGLSIQYAIVMGLIDHAIENHPGKAIKIIVPPNCYGGTNDQARRVAACLDQVEVMDLPVDGDNDMVNNTDVVLDRVAELDAVPLIIAEIPTNPRVEVPDLKALEAALNKSRLTPNGNQAISPVFILDQTFCPNYHFLGESDVLNSVQTISYVSGSKFPSGGLCTAGYCVANKKAEGLMSKIDKHLTICDNEATDLQLHYLAAQMPSMNNRIQAAYENTREFVDFIKENLSAAKINFVSEELANEGFTPSVFSLDLPTKGETHEEREAHKRALNLKLINRMIATIPNESKYCVSYGQLKGCYWTIPATSTQGTTKEGDKDYIVRVALSGDMDLERHKAVFLEFVEQDLNA